MSSNRGQHVVPKFYLNFFANDDGKVWCRHKADGRIFPAAPHDLAKERDAFSILNQGVRDNQFDAINNKVETFAAPQIKKLRDGIFDQDVIEAVKVLSANLITRSRYFRDKLLIQAKETAEALEQIPELLITKVREDNVLAMFGYGSWDPSSDAQLIKRASEITYPISQVLVVEVADWLASRSCTLIKVPPSAEFITSDDPVVMIKNGELIDLNGGVVSILEMQDLDVLIPLLPTVACMWKSGDSAPGAKENVATEECCHQVNMLIEKSAYQQVYASSKDGLERLVSGGANWQIIGSSLD